MVIGISVTLLVVSMVFSLINAQHGLSNMTGVSEKASTNQILAQLNSLRDNKKSTIEAYFNSIIEQNKTFSNSVGISNASREFIKEFKNYNTSIGADEASLSKMRKELKTFYTQDYSSEYKNQNGMSPDINSYFMRLSDVSIALQHEYIYKNPNPLGSKDTLDLGKGKSGYHKYHEKYHPSIRQYLKSFGYYDIFIVDIETGHIVYSVFKELDFGTSLLTGPNAGTNFAECFKRASRLENSDEVVLVDFKQYFPSYEAPASFIGSPVFDGDKKIAVVIFQMPLDRISEVMSISSGLGKTGETYLVGNDYLMRSDSFHDEQRSVIASFKDPTKGKVETNGVKKALLGKEVAEESVNYDGKEVLSSSAPVKVGEHTWAIVVEQEKNEALSFLEKLKIVSKSAENTLLIYSVSLIIAAIIISFILAFFAAKIFSAPIERNLEQTLMVDQAAQSNLEELENVVTSVEEITDVIKEISESSSRTATTTVEVVRVATKTSEEITALSIEAEEINGTLREISNIASKTDLIALNATIEAASAGEAGKSFAVVASEVKSLAEKITVAAENINQKMKNIQESLKEKAEDVSSVATESKQIEEATSQLASAIEELSITSDNINTSVGQVSENTSSVITQLKQSAKDLKEFIHGDRQ